MGLFNAVGRLFNTTETVGMWIVIGVATLLVVVAVCVVLILIKKRSDDLDFSGKNSIDLDVPVVKKQDDENTVEEFVTLKTDEQFETAKIEKVVATANEDIENENSVKQQTQEQEAGKDKNESVCASAVKDAEKVDKKPVSKKAKTSEKKEKPAVEVKPIAKKEVVAEKPVEVKEEVEQKEEPKRKVNGKWILEQKGQNEYISKLLASNGEVMLTSEIYASVDGAKTGIETIIKNVDSGKFVIYQDKNGNYYYKLKSSANRLLCVGEIYKGKEQCLNSVESVKRFASTAPISEEVFEGAQYITYTPAPLSSEVKKGTRGKWKVEKSEEGEYCAKLFASNGQLMLATEQVSQKSGALNSIASVKKNAELGNFIIDKDKFGRFYYKLRNAQKSVICIGETYDTLESCTSAIESVRRFALSATVPGEEE